MSLVEKVEKYQNNPSTGLLVGVIHDMAVALDSLLAEKSIVKEQAGCSGTVETAKKKKK